MRPYLTLFMLQSLDGKISTGLGDAMDFDRDIPVITKGIEDYYEAEKETDDWSMISGTVCAKLGANKGLYPKAHINCSFVVVDNALLTVEGINNVAANCKKVVLVTDSDVEARVGLNTNVTVLRVPSRYRVDEWVPSLWSMCCIQRITVQTGGTINAALLRSKLIDEIDVFVAPVIIGGVDTPSLADGESFTDVTELSKISRLRLRSFEKLPTDFLRLKYSVV